MGKKITWWEIEYNSSVFVSKLPRKEPYLILLQMLFTAVAWFIFITLWALLAAQGFCPGAMLRGRELRKGSVPWCCCSMHAFTCDQSLWLSIWPSLMGYWGWVWARWACYVQLSGGRIHEGHSSSSLGPEMSRWRQQCALRQNFVYGTSGGMSGALGQLWHKYIILLGKHHIRE